VNRRRAWDEFLSKTAPEMRRLGYIFKQVGDDEVHIIRPDGSVAFRLWPGNGYQMDDLRALVRLSTDA
jgi:hypothetical protein